ncbi:MAG: IS110 family transposase [Flammeovirgaceae bacterium]|nr:IS110 family transposase [Flammeovirgaceae bacterium]MBR08778.1 IS110 family transposase [Rickettsiales bacterium]HCX23292.1 IS110 family transposase [Cytophagales bacterium]
MLFQLYQKLSFTFRYQIAKKESTLLSPDAKKEKINLPKSLLCMEHTGIYNNNVLDFFIKKKIAVFVEHGRQIKQSMGMVRGKNDKVDALRICSYAKRFQDKLTLWKPERDALIQIRHFNALRKRLSNAKKQLKTPAKESRQWIDRRLAKRIDQINQPAIKSISGQIKEVEKKLKEIVQNDPQLKHLFELVTSVSGVGPVLYYELILTTKEFSAINNSKQYASYAGVAPFENRSGTSINGKNKVSQMANKTVKNILHMSALSVISRDGEMTDFYRRKVQEGKNKMMVVNAIRNKIIHRVFACVRKNEKYEKL